jgi:hypothetical protein
MQENLQGLAEAGPEPGHGVGLSRLSRGLSPNPARTLLKSTQIAAVFHK